MTVELERVEKFIDKVKIAFKNYGASGGLKDEIEEVITELEDLKLEKNNPVPTILPVCRHLDKAYGHINQKEPIASIMDVLSHLIPNLAWHHGYDESEMPGELAANFGVADVIGPYGLVSSFRFKLGVVLLAPQTWYPPHAHPSPEIYYILSGEAEWHTGGTKSVKGGGSMVLHGSNEPHAMLTGKTPLLTVYTWRGGIHTGSKFL